MSIDSKPTFTPKQITEMAQENANAFALASVAFLRERDISIDEFATYIGRCFAPGWEEMRGKTAREVAHLTALNMASVGAEVLSLTGDGSQAHLVIADWPSKDFCEFFSLSQSDVDPIWNLYEPVARYLDFNYTWKRRGDEVTMIFSR
jgi:hypothetical protein